MDFSEALAEAEDNLTEHPKTSGHCLIESACYDLGSMTINSFIELDRQITGALKIHKNRARGSTFVLC